MEVKARVLIIDDSALVRSVLEDMLQKDPEIEVVGIAKDPIQAIPMIKEKKPNVLTLDLEMPKMDGLTFLKKLMKVIPLPVIIISSRAGDGSEATIKALELGAVDFVTKPAVSIGSGLIEMEERIIEKVKSAAEIDRSKLRKLYQQHRKSENMQSGTSPAVIKKTDKITVLGASTGGTVAIRSILEALPGNLPPILIVLHMPAGFTASYAESLNKVCRMQVKEAVDSEPARSGYAYVAPGGKHMVLEKVDYQYYIRLTDAPPYNRHRPSVDVTFQSVAEQAKGDAVGIILTGMGTDGANGLRSMREQGAFTIAQDEKSSIVFGMPRKAIEIGAACEIVSLSDIPKKILEYNQVSE